LDQATLKLLLVYNPDTGVFTWTDKAFRRMKNKVAGSYDGNYVYIRVQRKTYAAHRLAFLYMTGKWPSSIVDHRNRNSQDNSWKNLREISYSGNMENTKERKGYYLDKRDGRFYAEISVQKKKQSLGGFNTAEEAGAAYKEAKSKLHLHYYAME